MVPEGVRVPVAAKADLLDANGGTLVRVGDVYFRTLGSNGTVSTSVARSSDWRDIVEICFENRDADIGRFLRRHIGDRDVSTLLQPQPTLRDRAEALLDNGERRYQEALRRRKLGAEQIKEFDTGAWGVALVVDPARPTAVADKQFLSSFAAANPNYSGWPVWQDPRGFTDPNSRPTVIEKGWESLLEFRGAFIHADFMRMDPKGEFYLHRLLPDDFSDQVQRGTALDAILVVQWAAEAIAVGLLKYPLIFKRGRKSRRRLRFGVGVLGIARLGAAAWPLACWE